MELRRFYSLPANTKPYLGGGESGLDVHRNDGKGWDVCIAGAHIHCSTGQESQPNILAFTLMVTHTLYLSFFYTGKIFGE